MSLPISEKNFLERLASAIPGIAGYREREARRETDRRLREYLAGRVEEARRAIDGLSGRVRGPSSLDLQDAAGRLDRTLQKSVAGLRFADGGYSGFFDQVKIREPELERIYAFDEALVGQVRDLAERVCASAGGSPDAAALDALAAEAVRLNATIGRRREIFHAPAQ